VSREKRDFGFCIDSELTELVKKNVVSALIKAFATCYSLYEEGKVKYVSEFSRRASLALVKSFTCENAKHLIEQASKYLEALYNEMSNIFSAVFAVNFTLTTRLSIYTRNPFMPLEIAISWDPVLNLPYIPSSSLKGAVRAWLELSGYTVIDGVSLSDVFGSSPKEEAKQVSLVVFSDAYPVGCVDKLIEPDVISPHYVGDSIAEVDVNPVPLVFPTLAPGTTMRFILALNYGLSKEKKVLDPKKAVKIAELVLKALERGIGAKTNVGYGRVKSVIVKSIAKQQQPSN